MTHPDTVLADMSGAGIPNSQPGIDQSGGGGQGAVGGSSTGMGGPQDTNQLGIDQTGQSGSGNSGAATAGVSGIMSAVIRLPCMHARAEQHTTCR